MKPRDFLSTRLGRAKLRIDLLEQLRRGPIPGTSDLDAATALVELVHESLRGFAVTDRMLPIKTDAHLELALKTLRAVLGRLGVDRPKLGFRDYTTLRTKFMREHIEYNVNATWIGQTQRALWLASRFEPIAERLARMEEEEFDRTLAEPVSTPGVSDWRDVDAEIDGLRRAFRAASTSLDYSNVGNACVRVLETVGEVVGDSSLRRDRPKDSIDQFVDARLPGKGNAELRRLAHTAVELAHRQKHRADPTRRDVGITADAVVLVVNILRRLAEGEVTKKTSMHA